MRTAASAFGLLLFFLSACVNSSKQVLRAGEMQLQISGSETAKLDPDKTTVCEMELVVGSHIPRRVCQSLREIEQNRLQASVMMTKSNDCNNGCF